jgi:hypothetical protein
VTYSLYGTWTIAETDSIGKKFKAICKGNRGMEEHLTTNKEYTVTITPRILPMSPLCSLVGDTGKLCECHLERFDKVGEIE